MRAKPVEYLFTYIGKGGINVHLAPHKQSASSIVNSQPSINFERSWEVCNFLSSCASSFRHSYTVECRYNAEQQNFDDDNASITAVTEAEH